MTYFVVPIRFMVRVWKGSLSGFCIVYVGVEWRPGGVGKLQCAARARGLESVQRAMRIFIHLAQLTLMFT